MVSDILYEALILWAKMRVTTMLARIGLWPRKVSQLDESAGYTNNSKNIHLLTKEPAHDNIFQITTMITTVRKY